MAKFDKRVERLFQDLTAKERAILMLQARKQGRPEDPLIHMTLPDDQARELGRLTNLMASSNWELGRLGLLVEARVEKLAAELRWLECSELTESLCDVVALYLIVDTKEPITQGAYDRLAKSGKTPQPWGFEFDIRPDRESDFVERLRSDRQNLKQMLQRVKSGTPGSDGALDYTTLRRRLHIQIESEWRGVRTIERVWAEVAAELNEEDPAHPYFRESIERAKSQLQLLRTIFERMGDQIQLEEPSAEELKITRQFITSGLWPAYMLAKR